MCNKSTTQPITNKENTKKKKDYRRKIVCKFSAKADSIYMMKLTKPFLKQALFWSHLTSLFKTAGEAVTEEEEIIRNKQSQSPEKRRDSIALLFICWKQVKQKIIKFEII